MYITLGVGNKYVGPGIGRCQQQDQMGDFLAASLGEYVSGSAFNPTPVPNPH
jgi:hypothetical protein